MKGTRAPGQPPSACARAPSPRPPLGGHLAAPPHTPRMRPRAPAASLLIARSRHRRPPPATSVGDRDRGRVAPRLRGGGVSLRKVRSRRRNAGRRWSLPLALQVGAAAAGAGREHPRKPPFFPQKSSLFPQKTSLYPPKGLPLPSVLHLSRPRGLRGVHTGCLRGRAQRGGPAGSPQASLRLQAAGPALRRCPRACPVP